MTDLVSGQSLASRFSLIRRLGRGGMGDVWLARDEDLSSEVVVKMVASEATSEQCELLRQECRHARRLSHPNIVKVFDFHQDPAAAFISMEYVDGGSLCELRGASPAEIVTAILPLLDALEYAHREGVVHRDLKCANVLIDGAGRPRLSDFGIAGLVSGGGERDLQLVGGGSGHMASPQQLRGDPPVVGDDVYGLGMMLQDLLAGSHPLPDELAGLLREMTSPRAKDRPADIRAVRSRLEAIGSWQVSSTTPPSIDKTRIRMTPPPRVPPVRQGSQRTAERTADELSPLRSGRLRWWMTLAAFLLLSAAMIAVFVVLPGWVEKRSAAAGTESAARPTPAEATPSPPVSSSPAHGSELGEREAEPPEIEGPEEEAVRSVPKAAERQPEAPSPASETAASGWVAPSPGRAARPDGEEFDGFMSQGLAALAVDDYEKADEAFRQALARRPESPEAADGLARAEQGLRLVAIREHRQRAISYEQEERWHEAAQEYQAALDLDPTLRFAREGRVQAEERARLADRMALHIKHSNRLVDDKVLQEARDVLAAAESIEPSTAGLAADIERLRQIIEIAATPVPIVLESDSLTEVTVYRVGRLGTFDRRQLDLRPGIYTVVGTRDGYRDVRRQLRVEPGGAGSPLVVRCEEKI